MSLVDHFKSDGNESWATRTQQNINCSKKICQTNPISRFCTMISLFVCFNTHTYITYHGIVLKVVCGTWKPAVEMTTIAAACKQRLWWMKNCHRTSEVAWFGGGLSFLSCKNASHMDNLPYVMHVSFPLTSGGVCLYWCCNWCGGDGDDSGCDGWMMNCRQSSDGDGDGSRFMHA